MKISMAAETAASSAAAVVTLVMGLGGPLAAAVAGEWAPVTAPEYLGAFIGGVVGSSFYVRARRFPALSAITTVLLTALSAPILVPLGLHLAAMKAAPWRAVLADPLATAAAALMVSAFLTMLYEAALRILDRAGGILEERADDLWDFVWSRLTGVAPKKERDEAAKGDKPREGGP